MTQQQDDRKGVQAVDKALSLLQCFSEDRQSLYLREFAAETGLYKSTILRLLDSLIRGGMVIRTADDAYMLGPQIFYLGGIYRAAFDLETTVKPLIYNLGERLTESLIFYVRVGDERVCLYRHNSKMPLRHHIEIGTRHLLSAGGSAAHVLRAWTEPENPDGAQIRERGYAISTGERLPGLSSISTGLFSLSGKFLGALVISGAAERFGAAESIVALRTILPEIPRFGVALPKTLTIQGLDATGSEETPISDCQNGL